MRIIFQGLLLLAIAVGKIAVAAELRGKIVDEASGNPIAARVYLQGETLLLAPLALPRAADAQQRTRAAGKVQTPPPSHPPLQTVDITKLPNGVERLDLFLLIGLLPCAVGGSSINLWQKGARLYDEALRRARLALQTTSPVKGRIRGVLWLQGEADASDKGLATHEAKLLKLIDDLRADLATPELPFIACTIGEMRPDSGGGRKADMNRLLLSLSGKRPHTDCVDARDLTGNIGDNVHFDTASQTQIGQRYAEKFLQLSQPE